MNSLNDFTAVTLMTDGEDSYYLLVIILLSIHFYERKDQNTEALLTAEATRHCAMRSSLGLQGWFCHSLAL